MKGLVKNEVYESFSRQHGAQFISRELNEVLRRMCYEQEQEPTEDKKAPTPIVREGVYTLTFESNE